METDRARELLRAERGRLQAMLRNTERDAGEDVDTVGPEGSGDEPSDAARDVLAMEETNSFHEHAQAELGEVEHALAKLEDGRYGLDERSGEPIPDERLEVRPQTRFTVANQALDERQADIPHRDQTTPDQRI